MSAARGPRPVRFRAYASFFLFFEFVLFVTHLSFLRLPYFWDEAGQFIPAARDILQGGRWIPVSVTPTIHPPAVMAYLAAFWRVTAFTPGCTRSAMLIVAGFGMLAAFLLAIELSKDAAGMPAFLGAALLLASPLFFAQAMLAQLDAPAMVLTTVALLLFVQERVAAAAWVSLALVLTKETGVVVPLTFAVWLATERRWREAAYFLGPVLALGVWVGAVYRTTGHWAGNARFAEFNLYFPLHAERMAAALARRIYYLFAADFRWIGTAAMVYAVRRGGMFRSRAWRVAGMLLAAHVVMLTILGGAVLERYLLPVLPVVCVAMAVGISTLPVKVRLAASGVLLAGAIGGNLVNPPYPFPLENNLAFTDFVQLQEDVAGYLEAWYPNTPVYTTWPLTTELSHAELGYVRRRVPVRALRDFSAETLGAVDWSTVPIVVVYGRDVGPAWKLLHGDRVFRVWQDLYGERPGIRAAQVLSAIPFPAELHVERRGLWADVLVNPQWKRASEVVGSQRIHEFRHVPETGAAQVLQ